MADNDIINPGAPFIPEQPPVVVQRQIVEWIERADLAQHAFDGQWRELQKWPEYGLHMMQRWITGVSGSLEDQHAVCPIGTLPPEDLTTGMSAPAPTTKSATEQFLAYIRAKRADGEAISLMEIIEESLCKAFRTPPDSGAVV